MKRLIFTLATVSVVISSCRKDVAPDVQTATPKATVVMNVNNKAGSGPLVLGDTLVDDFGTKYYFTKTKMYTSNYVFGAHDLNNYAFHDHENASIEIGEFEVGESFSSFNFGVGIDSLTNHSDPTLYGVDHPLYLQPGVHWGWAGGYRFIMIEGNFDANNDGVFNNIFGMHVGFDHNFKVGTVSLIDFTTVEGINYIDVDLDWKKLLDNVNLTTDSFTHSSSNQPLVDQITLNATTAFSQN